MPGTPKVRLTPASAQFWEIFAGKAGITAALQAIGCSCFMAVDIEVSQHVPLATNVLEDSFLPEALRRIKETQLVLLHFGTPCTTYSAAWKG